MQRLHTMLTPLADRLHRLTLSACSLLLAVALGAELAGVVLRYGFGGGALWLQDLALWCFSALALLAIPVAIGLDAHVRVDLFRERMRPSLRARFDRLAILLLLFPLFGLLAWLTWPQAVAAWRIGETSQQIGGLAGYWLVRFVPAVAGALSLLQGAAHAMRTGDNGGRA